MSRLLENDDIISSVLMMCLVYDEKEQLQYPDYFLDRDLVEEEGRNVSSDTSKSCLDDD